MAEMGCWTLVFFDRGIVVGGGIARFRDFLVALAAGTGSGVEGMLDEASCTLVETDV